MGSLPNLNSIGQDEQRRRDRDKLAARLPAIGGDTRDDRQRTTERQPMLVQHSNYTDGVGRSSAPSGYQYQVQHRNSLTARRVHRTCSSGTTNRIGDESMIEHMTSYSPISSRSHRNTISLPTAQQYQHHHHHHHHHLPAALPSHPPSAQQQHFQHQHQHSTGSRHTRRDSVNSSIGANSIRHLLTIRRSIGAGGAQSTHATGGSGGGGGGVNFGVLVGMGTGCRHKIPIHIKAKVARNFAILCAAHCLTSAILVPMFGLQAASSAWLSPVDWTEYGANSGAWLLVASHVAAATTVLFTQRLLQAVGYVPLLLAAYGTVAAFVAAHIYSSLWTLVPAYALLGAVWAPASCAKWNLVVFFASRISCGQQECNTGLSHTAGSMEAGIGTHLMADDQHQQHQQHPQHPPAAQQVSATMGSSQLPRHCNRDERIRRLARWFHAAENAGIVGGALLAALVMTWCARNGGCEVWGGGGAEMWKSLSPGIIETAGQLAAANVTTERVAMLRNYDAYEVDSVPTQMTPIDERQQLMLDAMFNVDSHGARICGADACPKSWYTDVADIWTTTTTATVPANWDATGDVPNANRTEMLVVASESQAGATVLVMAFLALATLALFLTAASSQVDNTFKRPAAGARCWTDTIIFAGPMAYFVGTEQAYMLGDFTKSFVSCSLGLQKVAGSLVGMGLMQLVVSCTLSMLLRHTKRYAVLAAGFFFHACLLLVLFCWKPSSDDSALFYVIAAAWGACNAMWETLLFALITLTHASQVVAVSAQVQLWRYVGLAVTFAAHGWLCEQVKITILFVLLCVTVVPYAMLEGRLEAQRRNHHREDM